MCAYPLATPQFIEESPPAVAYFPTPLPGQYRRRWGVSLPCSGWERVGPPRSNHQGASSHLLVCSIFGNLARTSRGKQGYLIVIPSLPPLLQDGEVVPVFRRWAHCTVLFKLAKGMVSSPTKGGGQDGGCSATFTRPLGARVRLRAGGCGSHAARAQRMRPRAPISHTVSSLPPRRAKK